MIVESIEKKHERPSFCRLDPSECNVKNEIYARRRFNIYLFTVCHARAFVLCAPVWVISSQPTCEFCVSERLLILIMASRGRQVYAADSGGQLLLLNCVRRFISHFAVMWTESDID